jgi:SAM-dependent methyltransferase
VDLLGRYYPESRFGGFSDVDGTVLFYFRARALIEASSVVLDVGCGRGVKGEDPIPARRDLQILTGACARVIGIDIDTDAQENPYVDEFRLIADGPGSWPVGASEIDVCIVDSVVEHIESPNQFFFECARVTKPGGYLCIRTANVLSYAGMISRLIRNRLHAGVLAKVQAGRKGVDVFPTVYRCNTIGRIRRLLDKHGFDHCVYGYEAEPAYLSFSRLLYRLGVLYQRLAPSGLRTAIFAFARRRLGEMASPTSEKSL